MNSTVPRRCTIADTLDTNLRSDIQVVAERLSMLDGKVERFRGEVHQEFGKVDRRFLHLDARIPVLESR